MWWDDDPKTVPGDEEVIGASAYSYVDEVLVEVTCRDADGSLVVYSYQFDAGEDGEVHPVESIPDRHCETVREVLAEKGYEPASELAGT